VLPAVSVLKQNERTLPDDVGYRFGIRKTLRIYIGILRHAVDILPRSIAVSGLTK
jgi:hypothetical protein